MRYVHTGIGDICKVLRNSDGVARLKPREGPTDVRRNFTNCSGSPGGRNRRLAAEEKPSLQGALPPREVGSVKAC